MVGGLIQKKKQEDHRADVQKKADDMMTGGMGSEQAPVQHMGNHRQGNPVVFHNVCKSPFDALIMNAGLDVDVFGNVSVVIEIDEIIAGYPAEGGQRSDD